MLINGTVPGFTPLKHYDVCIVGAGAAGITLARKMASRGKTVCLLESGGLHSDPEIQKLNDGAYSGSFELENAIYLSSSRLRVFGGTTYFWTGFCAPLQDSCFEERKAVPHSGWPIGPTDLAPYYPEAAETLQITPPVHDSDAGYSENRRPLLVNRPHLRTLNFHMSPPTRFGDRYRDEVAGTDNIHTLLNTTAVNLALEGDSNRVTSVTTRTLSGQQHDIHADQFVLATGGVENARLLLHFNQQHGQRLGNRHDQVGRYFMDHLSVHMAGSWVRNPRSKNLMAYLYQQTDPLRGHATKSALTVSPEWIERRGLPNFLVHAGHKAPTPQGSTKHITRATKAIDQLRGVEDPRGFPEYFQLITEPPLDPNNRITLTNEKDALGVPRPHLNFQVPPDYPDTCIRCMRALVEAVGAEGIGRGRVDVDLDMDRWFKTGQFTHMQDHHNGGTRMSHTDKTGVVDADCKVHGVDNLYVASSSVFSTGGVPNPTYTIVALTLRLADHLMKKGGAA